MKIPETIDALASLIGKTAEAAKDISAFGREQQSGQAGKVVIKLYEIVIKDH